MPRPSLRSQLRRYLLISALAFCLTLLAAMSAVLLIDPYGVFQLAPVDGFNARKVRLSHSQFEVRSRNAARLQADTWILGNSRAEMGFDPQHPVFRQNKLAAYNLAVPGAGGAMSLQFAEALAVQQTPKRVILGVDFLDFLVDTQDVEPPLRHYQPSSLEDARWLLGTLFSARSTLDAIKTLGLQRDPYAAYLTAQGFNPMLDYVKETRTSGAHAMFAQRAQESAKTYASKPRSLVTAASGTSVDWQALEATLLQAKPGATRVDVVIYPYHAQMRWLFAAFGLDGLFDDWRQDLVKRVDKISKSQNLDVRVWDFSGFTSFHCEPIPAPSDRKTALKWYWEGGHFKKELGDHMLNQLFDVADGLPPLGIQVTPGTLPAKKTQDQLDETRCRSELPTVLAGVQSIKAKTAVPARKPVR